MVLGWTDRTKQVATWPYRCGVLISHARGTRLMLSLALSVILWGSAGCASITTNWGTLHRQTVWAQNQGGVLVDTEYDARLTACADRLNRRLESDVRLSLLNNNAISAYAWPDGHLYVTRGLMDRMNDDELEAAMAHEIGHLLDHGNLRTTWSLNNPSDELNTESRADIIGSRLLQQMGLGIDTMIRMLEKVTLDENLSKSSRERLKHRIAILRMTPTYKPAPDLWCFDYGSKESTLLGF